MRMEKQWWTTRLRQSSDQPVCLIGVGTRLLSAESAEMAEVTEQSSWSLDKPFSIILSCVHESMEDSMGVMHNFYNLCILLFFFQSLLGRQHNLPGLCWACVSTSAQPAALYLEVDSARLLLSVTFTKYLNFQNWDFNRKWTFCYFLHRARLKWQMVSFFLDQELFIYPLV